MRNEDVKSGRAPCKNPDKAPLPLCVQVIFRREFYSILTHPVYDFQGSVNPLQPRHHRVALLAFVRLPLFGQIALQRLGTVRADAQLFFCADADSFINVFIIAAYESPCTGMTTIDRQHDSTTDAAA